jgi:hypothetical protein
MAVHPHPVTLGGGSNPYRLTHRESVERRMRGDAHVRCGGRARETNRWQHRHRARTRPLQINVLQRQLGAGRPRFEPADRALLAAQLAPLPRQTLRRLRLIVQPDTVLRWHRNLIKRRHAERSRPKRPGRPRTVASLHRLVLRLAHKNPA